MVGMWHPGCTVTACPELIVKGEELLALGHTWLVAIVPEYTNQVLLPRLKIFPLVSEIRNLQLALISIALARKREPMQSLTMLALSTVRPSQKNVEPSHLQLARSDDERVWKELVSPMVMRSTRPTCGTTEMFALKLKWIGKETNSYSVKRWSASMKGTCRIKIIVCSSGWWIKEMSSL